MTDWDESTKTAAVLPGGSEAGVRRAYLVVLSGTNLGEMYEVRSRMVLGRAQDADIRFADDGVSRRHALLDFDGEAVFIEDMGSRNGTMVNDQKVTRAVLEDGDKIRIGSNTILKFTHQDALDDSFQRQLFDAALRDGLTRAYNKKYFFDRLENEVAYALRHGAVVSLVMLDIDRFKNVNDAHGHVAGDYVLAMLARAVHDSIRTEDVFARFGGDEFGLICRGVDGLGAVKLAERLRVRIAAMDSVFDGATIKITASFGVASVPMAAVGGAMDLVQAADRALYRAKHAGRDIVVLFEPDDAPQGQGR